MGTALRDRAEKEIRERARVAGARAREVGGRFGERFGETTKDTRERLGKSTKDTRKRLGQTTKDARRKVGYWVAGEEPAKPRTRLWTALALGAGAVAAFFFDPVSGKRRRHVTRDWVAARARGAGRRIRRAGRAAGAEAYGTWQAATHVGESMPPENDAVLAHKVESEALRQSAGRINVNAEEGVVVLRGAVDRPEEIDEIERRVRRVGGVRGVRNLLHLEGTRAPTG
jgi:hypothetical protein